MQYPFPLGYKINTDLEFGGTCSARLHSYCIAVHNGSNMCAA